VKLTAPEDKLVERELGLGCLAHHAGTEGAGDGGGPGGRFRMDRQTLSYADWRPADNAEFEFSVPPDAPYSYEGDVVSFYWGIWLRREGRVLDREAYVPLVVEP
jgi:hypothetical protein